MTTREGFLQISSSITVGAINITASPHNKDTYRLLIKNAAGRIIRLGGSDQAMLTEPNEDEHDSTILHGRICVWAEIDKRGDWFNKKTHEKATESDKDSVVIPEEIAPNYRYFIYAIDLTRHLIIYEMKNEFRQTFGHARAAKFFSQLFKDEGEKGILIDTTVIPEEGTVNKY